MWKMVNNERIRTEFKEFQLESDSYLRQDHLHLRLKEYDSAEKEKYDLEEQQRRDKKNRENAAARLKSARK